MDRDTQIDFDLAHSVTQILKLEVRITACVADDDETAAPAHHLVQGKILEMPAIRKIDIFVGVAGHSQHFREERDEGIPGTVVLVRDLPTPSGVAQPPAEANVEERH